MSCEECDYDSTNVRNVSIAPPLLRKDKLFLYISTYLSSSYFHKYLTIDLVGTRWVCTMHLP